MAPVQLTSCNTSIRVVVRVRPLNARERARNARCLIKMHPSTQATTIYPPTDDQDPANARALRRKLEEQKTFTFDHSLWSVDEADPHFAPQAALHDRLGREFVQHALEGYNCCILAYGQTGSGKTHSMAGTQSDPGLVPRICNEIFDKISQRQSAEGSHATFQVSVNYYEIYNETATDLLLARDLRSGSQPRKALRVRESPETGPYLEGLSEFHVSNYSDVDAFMQLGNSVRRTASTKMNDTSSRSHAVFTLTIQQTVTDGPNADVVGKTSRFRLVDLAGSERATATGATGERLREGANINKSLTTLGRVISRLAELPSARPTTAPVGHVSAPPVVPYRDSILTWLLSDSLGGNSKTAMIACISPADYEETLTTLRYADAVKKISLHAKVNEKHERAGDAAAAAATQAKMSQELKEMQSQLALSQREKQELQRFEAQAKALERMIARMSQAAEDKIARLERENEALRCHLRLAVETIRHPLPDDFGCVSDDDFETLDQSEATGPVRDMEARLAQLDVLDQELLALTGEADTFAASIQDQLMHFPAPGPLRPMASC
ncbi:P-loop containing nucleoside triphosphate hydrolase protein [Protomyces lactucae-debilis]|uniref:Kinesin-like protein n=1 Tax=Protomyces lactucae-debilis TaxID=2754530 RepID=A0A1Y2FNE1_PROLT|nr:P-loop containing nucleoside triphosphate hydrolase protein [Protomyces lactucae-debilis]ORY85511.1 P-loop containing nucleoside triphosphate hydrolase protein [Protomyces lactucae-debilis]